MSSSKGMKVKARHTFILLSLLFLLYSLSIYLQPVESSRESFSREKASTGRLVWQKYNCQSCHQLFGLGGYLGPDLTNLFAQPEKGEIILRAMLSSGTKQMPSFALADTEVVALIEFLKSTNASGKADPRSFKITNFWMIETNEKQER